MSIDNPTTALDRALGAEERSNERVCVLEDTPSTKPAEPDMFWNADDSEMMHQSIEEFLSDEICNGSLEVGSVYTILQAKSLPNVIIKITSIDDNESEAEYEVVTAAPQGETK